LRRSFSKAVEDGAQEYFSSPEICEILRVGVIRQIDKNGTVQDIILKEMKTTGKYFDREFKDIIKIQTQSVAADRFHDSLVHIVHTAGGTALGHVVLSALSMPAVKVALLKIGGSVLMMEGMRAVITKIGITTLSVCFLGQAAASSFLPVLAIPIIIGVITYQYIKLPNTLAEKIPLKIAAELGDHAPSMNQKLAKKFVKASFEKLFETIREEAMESNDEIAMPSIHEEVIESDSEEAVESDDEQDSGSDNEEAIESEDEEDSGSDASDNDQASIISSVRSLVEYHQPGRVHNEDSDSDGERSDSDEGIVTLYQQ
jgi:hypothetical protein